MNRQQAEIDWDNAPEGATHRSKTGGFYKIANAVACYFDSYRNWTPSVNNQEWLNKNLIPRPTEQPYMPQVGEVCEVIFHDDANPRWYRTKFVAIVNERAVLIYESDVEWPVSKMFEFRPLKTERGELIEIIDSCNMSSGVLADVILKAGYRKND